MPTQYQLANSNTTITVEDTPFASGGEGSLFRIAAPATHKKYVLKLYHPNKRSQERIQKIAHLVANPPADVEENIAIVWPVAQVLENGKFVGCLMPFAKGVKLEMLCLAKLPKKYRKRWARFDLSHSTAQNYRLRVGFNLAVALYQIHAKEQYVLVDLKPDNVLLQPNGLIGLVDLDSVAVLKDQQVIFPAPVATPEYTPPEHYVEDTVLYEDVHPVWDSFSFGVILYKVLFGIHPFTASAGFPYEHLVSLHQKIEHGLFVHAKEHKHVLKVVPPLHQAFHQLPEELKGLFMRCFEDGHHTPLARPRAEEWCAALLLAINDPQMEARYKYLLQQWNTIGGASMPLIGNLQALDAATWEPKTWIEQRLQTIFKQPPALPLHLHELIEKGVQAIKLELKPLDYFVALFIGGGIFMALKIIPNPIGQWLVQDFWFLSVVVINLILIGSLLFTFVLLPRLVSLIRDRFSNLSHLRDRWKDFSQYYPQLEQKAKQIYAELTPRLEQISAANDTNFAAARKAQLEPLKDVVRTCNTKIQDLHKAQQADLVALQQQQLDMIHDNALLDSFPSKRVANLKYQLQQYYKKTKQGLNDNTGSDTAVLEVLEEEVAAAEAAIEAIHLHTETEAAKIKEKYEKAYEAIKAKTNQEITTAKLALEALNQSYQIKVNDLLQEKQVVQLQQVYEKEVQQAEKDIRLLIDLKDI